MSSCQSLWNLMKKFDHYGVRPSLFFKGKNIKGTGFGCCLTMFLLIITLLCFVYFGQNLYYRKNPNLKIHDEYIPDPQAIVIDPATFPILIELNDVDAQQFYTDPQIITANISQYSRVNSINSLTNYSLEICNKSHISGLGEAYRNYFENKNLSTFFCIPKDLKNLTIQGAFDREIFHTIKVSFSICNTGSCKPRDEIKQLMSRGFIGIYFLDNAVDPGNFNNPKQVIPKEVFTNFVLDKQKELDIYFKNNYLRSEQGVIFDEEVDYQIVTYDEFQEMNFMVEDDNFLAVYFKVKQKQTIYQRSYEKMQDVLGLLGGFLNIFYLLGWLLNLLYTRLILITDILLDIFTIKISKSVEKRKANPFPIPDQVETPIINNCNNRNNTGNSPLFSPSIDRSPPSKDFLERKGKRTLENMSNSVEIPTFSKTPGIFKNNSETLIKHPNNKELNLSEIDLEKPKEPFYPNEQDFNQNEQIKDSILLGQNNHLLNSKINFKQSIDAGPQIALTEDIMEVEKLELTMTDYLFIYTGLFKTPERVQKKIMINKGLEIMRRCLDVKFIIQKFYEIEKLKQLLLSDSQLDVFRYLPKPEIILNLKENFQSKKKHSIHTKVLRREESLDNMKMTEREKMSALLRTSITKRNKIGKKLARYTDNIIRQQNLELNG